jgi:hypothetical protein
VADVGMGEDDPVQGILVLGWSGACGLSEQFKLGPDIRGSVNYKNLMGDMVQKRYRSDKPFEGGILPGFLTVGTHTPDLGNASVLSGSENQAGGFSRRIFRGLSQPDQRTGREDGQGGQA